MPDTQWGRPAGCYTGCKDECNQGRLPCPHRADDVAAMREMGVDISPQHRDEWDRLRVKSDPLPLTRWTLLLAVLAVAVGACPYFWK